MFQRLRHILLIVLISTIFMVQVSSQDAEESDGVAREITVTAIHKTSPEPSTTTTTIIPTSSRPTSSTEAPPPHKTFPQNTGSWNVSYPNNASNSACIIFKAALQLELNSTQLFENNTVLKIDIPVDAQAIDGTCGNITQILRLEWETSSNTSNYDWALEVEFGFRLNNVKQYDIQRFALFVQKFNPSNHKIAEVNVTLDTEGPYFPTDFNHSYLCNSKNAISGTGNITIRTAFLQFEAFRPNSTIGYEFSDAEICSTDKPATGIIIGIALGSAIAILLAVTLGVYVAMRYGYCNFPCCSCCNGGNGYQRLDI